MNPSFKERLKRGDVLIGTILSIPSPEVAEVLALAGFDWLFIDAEHGTIDFTDVQRILQIADDKCPCIVRTPSDDKIWIKKLLDAGSRGIIFPLVNSRKEAQRIVNLCKYPPEGTRSIGIGRAHEYGFKFMEYVSTANQNIAIILQIEHTQAVRNIKSIVTVQGIDAIFIGPYDLSGSLGKIGQVNDPEVKKEINIVKKACKEAGLPIGIFGVDAEAVKPFISQGYSLITVGMDTLFLGKSVRETLGLLKT